jgi:DNA (cytosine-5)-methyltransferase 1
LEELGYQVAWGIFSAAECGAPHQRKRVFIMAHRIDQGLQGRLRGWQNSGREDQHGHAGCSGAGVHGWWPSRPGQPQHTWEPPRVVGNAESGQDNGREPGNMGEAAGQWGCSNDAADGAGEGLGDAESERSAALGAEHEGQCGELCSTGPSSEGNVGDTSDSGQPQWGSGTMGQPEPESQLKRPDSNSDNTECETQPTLGGDAHGTPGGLDYAKLSVSCDNRTDELRLLGNGVVPATAELAFKILLNELHQNRSTAHTHLLL